MARPQGAAGANHRRSSTKRPYASAVILLAIALLCLAAGLIAPGDAQRMDFAALLAHPSTAHLFGTDALGRDLFKMILYGGQISLLIGLLASAIAAAVAIVYGTVAGLAPKWLDGALMRLSELVMSIPSILIVVVILGLIGGANLWSLAAVIGLTSWMAIAKIVRSEVRQIRGSEYVLFARLSNAGFLYILRQHLLPIFLPSILFMLIYNVAAAIAAEATLSFLGLGMPSGTATWGTLMSLAEDALLTNSWWVIVIPSAFLVTTLVCMTNIGEYLRKSLR